MQFDATGISLLKTQLQIFSKNFPPKEHLFFEDIHNYFKDMEPSSRRLLSEVGKILELVVVLPATNATSERNFSKMKLIKTPIRSTMSHERLNHCMIFSTHKEKVDELNLTKLATKFVKKSIQNANAFLQCLSEINAYGL